MRFKPLKHLAPPAAAALLLLLAGQVCAQQTKAAGGWTSVRSKNFMLVGDADERDIRKVAARLEQFREAFMRLLPLEHFDSFAPVTVMVFKTDEAYMPFEPLYQGRPAGVSGFFQSNQDVDYITLSIDRGRVKNPFALAFHEYVHLLVRNGFSSPPLWFNEGLAEYYSTFEISDEGRKVTLGKPVGANRLRVLAEGKLLPLETLFGVATDSEIYQDKEKRGLFYAQSWALVHYLLSGPRRAQLSNFLTLRGGGATLEESFRRAFGADFPEVEGELALYINQSKYPRQVIKFDERLEFDSMMQGRVMPESEAQFYLGDLLMHTNRLEAAEPYLRKAVELDPGLARAQASLGVLRMRQNRPDEAVKHLKVASEAADSNYLIHYYYAYVLSREGAGSDSNAEGYYDPERAELIRSELRRAIELAPKFAEAYRLLAFVNLVRDERLDESVALLKKGMELSPRSYELALLLAQLYSRRDEFDLARETLRAAIRGSNNPQTRARAETLLAAVAAREQFMARVKALEAEAVKEVDPPRAALQPCDAPQPGPQIKKLRFEGRQACGMLVQVECEEGGVLLLVSVGERTLRLHSDRLSRIRFVTYTAEVKGQVTCGLRAPANPVLITYRPAEGANEKYDGEVIAVEFVPRDWNANH